mmetsp:Transcript_29232/g.72179  ORF Transcript_29232/g.72179 Transcript_29232/m.72179 type:complete len:206 (-) Transcript_29232:392-1009(-)
MASSETSESVEEGGEGAASGDHTAAAGDPADPAAEAAAQSPAPEAAPGEKAAGEDPPPAPAPAQAGSSPLASPGAQDARRVQISEDAQRIAQLLSISPDVINISVNVGFNTKVAVEEILNLRSENADLRQENRRLRARAGEEASEKSDDAAALQAMTHKELLNLVQVTEARVRELELINARTRVQMTFMPERVHTAGHAGKPWAD